MTSLSLNCDQLSPLPSPAIPSPSSAQQQSTNNRHSDNLALWSHISNNLVEMWINDKNSDKRLLLIDCRDSTEYNTLHIKNAINLFDSPVIRKQLVSDIISINELLVKYSKIDLINTNLNEFNIVVYDHRSEHTNQLDYENEFAVILLRKLIQKYPASVSFLSGGFKDFADRYPHSCVPTPSLRSRTSSTTVRMDSVESSAIILDEPQQQQSMDVSPVSNPNSHHVVVMRKLPRQLKLSHSLSTFGFDGCTAIAGSPTVNQSSGATDATDNTNTNRLAPSSLFVSLKSCPSSSESPDASALASIPSSVSSTTLAIRQPTKILNYLYLGSEEDATCKVTMETLGITSVLNVSVNCKQPEFIKSQNFLRIPVNDGPADKILPFFDIAYRFIEKCRKANKKVIIHCLAGISRSPTLAIAYLMKHKGIKSDEAYKFVKERRHSISPNFNFLGQLYEYEKQQQLMLASEKVDQDKSATVESNTNEKTSLSYSIPSTTTTTSTTAQQESTQMIKETSSQQQNRPPVPTATPHFLKFGNKRSTLMNLTTSSSNQHSNMAPTTPTIHVSHSSVSGWSADHQLDRNSGTFQFKNDLRKKQFVFEFNSNGASFSSSSSTASTSNPNNNNLLIQSPSASVKSLQIHSPVYSLNSPSHAFSSFHLNSPTTTHAPSSLHSSSNTQWAATQQPSQASIPKSYTMNTINNQASQTTASTPTSNVVLRRPTNLLLANSNVNLTAISPLVSSQPAPQSTSSMIHSSTMSRIAEKPSSNNLKRPSSILFSNNLSGNGSHSGSNESMTPMHVNMVADSTLNSPFLPSTTSGNHTNNIGGGVKHFDVGHVHQFLKFDPAYTRSLSNNSAGSSSSSCCSCSSSSTTSSSMLCNMCINNTNSVTSTNTNSSYMIQKKLKLSPIQDKLVNFTLPIVAPVAKKLSSPSATLLTANEVASMFTSSLFDQENFNEVAMSTGNSGGSGGGHQTPNKAAGTPLTPTSILNTDNLISCFGQKLNESKSYENIKQALTNSSTSDMSGDTEDIENNGGLRVASSMSLNSINVINAAAAAAAAVATTNPPNSKSGNNSNSTNNNNSSGSSKSGSNKNSLHGSIETMIEVS